MQLILLCLTLCLGFVYVAGTNTYYGSVYKAIIKNTDRFYDQLWDTTSSWNGMTEMQRAYCVKTHNELRSLEEATSMNMLFWNSYLADMAKEWAKGCQYDHGQPSMTDLPSDYSTLGQNLYMNTGPTGAGCAEVTEGWAGEKADFTFDEKTGGTCADGKVCGHYTQVVWDRTEEVGCAYHFCPILTDNENSKTYENAHYYVCNYWPAGNLQGTSPFIKRTSDDEHVPDCVRNGFMFDNRTDQCVPPEYFVKYGNRTGCTPGVTCSNGGVFDQTNCRCQCQSDDTIEYHGNKCTSSCADNAQLCPAYDPYCDEETYPQYTAFMTTTCGIHCDREYGSRRCASLDDTY